MENAKSILSHTFSKPFQNRLETIKCLNLVFSMLPPNIKNGISYSYLKEETLTIVVVSNPFKSELNYKKSLLKELLEMVKKHHKNCENVTFNEIKIFVDRKIEIEEREKILVYEEQAVGDFENLAQNTKIKEILEKIREVIKKSKL